MASLQLQIGFHLIGMCTFLCLVFLKIMTLAGLHLQIGFQLTATCIPESGVPDNDDFVSLDELPAPRRQLYNSRNR